MTVHIGVLKIVIVLVIAFVVTHLLGDGPIVNWMGGMLAMNVVYFERIWCRHA